MENMKKQDLIPEINMKEHVKIDIKKMMQDVEDGLMPIRCIYQVPPMIRNLKANAYTPMAVSIGPFHYGDNRLQDMEMYKAISFKRFERRAKVSFDEMVDFVIHSEPKVRASYSEPIILTKNDFVKLLLVDASFIIELFMNVGTGEITDNAELSQAYLFDTIEKDLLLLENQLPFFLIEDLFNLAFPPVRRADPRSFLELTYSFFKRFNKQNLEPNGSDKIKHFTDLLRLFYIPRRRTSFSLKAGDLLKYSANELQEAGVKLESIESNCLLDLQFSEDVLKIPRIRVEDDTELLFRNMITLEHCHYPFNSYITDYAVVMHRLISTKIDADVLFEKATVLNPMSVDTQDAVALFDGLQQNIIHLTSSKEIIYICRKLNEFCRQTHHMRKATLMPTLKRDYCGTPWRIAASLGGILLLILTLVQTIFSILQVVLT